MRRIPRKVGPYGIAVHHFRKASRILPPGVTQLEYFRLIDAQRSERQTAFAKYFALSVIIFIILTANGVKSTVGIKTTFIEITVPAVYIFFFQSILIGIGFLELLSFQLLTGYRQVASDAIRGSFSNPDLLAIIYRSESAWASLVVDRWSFLKFPSKFKFGQYVSIIFIVTPMVAIYAAIYATQFRYIYEYLSNIKYNLLEILLCFIAIFLMLAPISIVIFSSMKFQYSKNTNFVRWSFLHKLYKKLGQEQVFHVAWLQDNKNN